MFSLNIRDPFGCRGVSCVKLPAAVSFPTDAGLMQRIEESRRALPSNNMKPLRKPRAPLSVVSASAQRVRDPGETRPFLQLVRIEELHLRNKAASGQH